MNWIKVFKDGKVLGLWAWNKDRNYIQVQSQVTYQNWITEKPEHAMAWIKKQADVK